MGRYEVDLLDGFDGREVVYDEKKEKSYQARIWWALLIAAVLILLRGVTFHINEMKMKKTWTPIVAEYHEQTAEAYYTDENGIKHHYSLAGFAVEHVDGKVTLYYEQDVNFAEPVHIISFWIKTYFIFGVAIALFIWRLWMIYKK